MPRPEPEFGQHEHAATVKLAELALSEDLSVGRDVTSVSTIPISAVGQVQIVCREAGVLAGLPVIPHVFDLIDGALSVENSVSDGDSVSPGTVVATLSGSVRSLLAAERTILNFMTHLSGIASLTSRYVEAVAGTSAVVLDTRKTLPGWRRLAKYAVRCGGGTNHRMGLYDGVLIKDNHIASWRQSHGAKALADMISEVRTHVSASMPVEIEVDNLDQLRDVLAAKPEIVLLDNMSNDMLREAVSIRNDAAPSTKLEASGGVTLDTIAGIAATGVDRISVGAITHSARNFDLGFDWV